MITVLPNALFNLLTVPVSHKYRMNFSYKTDQGPAQIIMLPGNETSEKLAARCMASCKAIGQKAEYYPGFDGTSGEIKAPINDSWLSWIKVTDKHLSITEVACSLSHISLWAKCIQQDRPLIILEHDTIMVKALTTHPVYGVIDYLGSREQKNGWKVLPTPPHATNGPNYHFMCRAHAYSIDPAVAKNLMSHVIKYGIHESLDIMIRADIFPIVQTGFHAYDEPGEITTITGRKQTPDGKER